MRLALILLLLVMAPFAVQAQGFQERHLVLTDGMDEGPIDLLPYLYLTKDVKKEIGTREFIRRLRSRLPGDPVTEPLLNFSFHPYPHWLSMQLTNEDAREEWLLDLGTLWQGRSGIAAGLFIMDAGSGKMLLDGLPRENGTIPDGDRLSTQLPVTIPQGNTARLIFYVLPTDTAPLTMPLRLVPAQEAALKNRSVFNKFDPVILVLSAGMLFFTFCLWFKVGRVFVPFILFFALNLLLTLVVTTEPVIGGALKDYAVPISVVLNILLILWMTHAYLRSTDPAGANKRGEAAPMLLYIVAAFNIVGLLIFFFILPQGTAFRAFILQIPFYAALLTALFLCISAERNHRRGARDLAMAWFVILVGHAVGLVTVIGWVPITHPMLVQAPILSIALSSIWLISAAIARFAAAQDILIKRVIRKAQQAQTTARIKQSKENADQARLLRIIEREREIMEELRLRDAQRTEDMRIAKEQADEANKAKSAFLAVVSHEIRTPMTGIMGMLRLLRNSPLTADQADYVQTIQDSGDAMMALLNDILDFSKIQGGSMVLETLDFDLVRLISGVVMLMSGHAAQKNIDIKADIAGQVPNYVKGDPTRLRQVLLNLAGNAIKFTAQGGVTIQLTRDNKVQTTDKDSVPIRFSVIDTGIGISEEAQKNLFSPFAQADSSIARKYGGTGLGLAICKTLIEAMGAQIQLHSVEGQGTTFSFTLIMPQGQAADAIEHQNSDAIATSQQTQDAQNVEPRNILIVDDNAINRKVIASMLEPQGHVLTMLDNAEEVLTLLSERSFDLILMDIEMPGLSGDEATKMVRATYPQHQDLPIIGLTGHTVEEEAAVFKMAGMNAILHKPIDPDALDLVIRHEGWPKPPAGLAGVGVEAMDLDSDSFAEASSEQDPFQTLNLSGDQPAFDHKTLEALKQSMSRDEMDAMFTDMFAQADIIITAMRDAFEEEDFGALQARAHEIKGMCGNFGLMELSNIAGHIETLSGEDKPNIHSIGKMLAALPEAQLAAQEALASWLDEG